jgi:hypothetical protein
MEYSFKKLSYLHKFLALVIFNVKTKTIFTKVLFGTPWFNLNDDFCDLKKSAQAKHKQIWKGRKNVVCCVCPTRVVAN